MLSLIYLINLVTANQCNKGEFECLQNKMKICSEDGIWVITNCPLNMKCSKTASSIACTPETGFWDLNAVTSKPKDEKLKMEITIDPKDLELKDSLKKNIFNKKIKDNTESTEGNEFMRLVGEREFLFENLKKNRESLLHNSLLSSIPMRESFISLLKGEKEEAKEEEVNAEETENTGEAENPGEDETAGETGNTGETGNNEIEQSYYANNKTTKCNCKQNQTVNKNNPVTNVAECPCNNIVSKPTIEMKPVIKPGKPRKVLKEMPPLMPVTKKCDCKERNARKVQSGPRMVVNNGIPSGECHCE